MVKKNKLFILFLTVGCLFADPPNWEINPADYQYNGSATSAVYLNDELIGSENDVLAGFVGDEVRGVVNGLYFPVTGNYTFNIMLFSNLASGETITFKYYNAASNQVFCLDVTIDLQFGCFTTLSILIDLILACAWGLLKTLPYNIPGKFISAPYKARPVTLSLPSWRIGDLPITLNFVSLNIKKSPYSKYIL